MQYKKAQSSQKIANCQSFQIQIQTVVVECQRVASDFKHQNNCHHTVLGHHGHQSVRRKMRQFCTTPPVGILLGSRSKSLGWIPTVAIPNPDQPPLMIFLTQRYFCTKRKLNKHVIATSSQQNPNNFFSIQFSISFVEVSILVG